jgi:hypothetical protein
MLAWSASDVHCAFGDRCAAVVRLRGGVSIVIERDFESLGISPIHDMGIRGRHSQVLEKALISQGGEEMRNSFRSSKQGLNSVCIEAVVERVREKSMFRVEGDLLVVVIVLDAQSVSGK